MLTLRCSSRGCSWIFVSLAAVMLMTAVAVDPSFARNLAAGQEQQVTDFDIPAQPLARALAAWALATRVQVSYPQDEPLEVASQAVSGKMTPDQALARMLTSTGFTYRYERPDAVTLVRVQTDDVEGARVLGPVRVEGARAEGSGRSHTRGPGAGNEVEYRNPTTEGTGSYTTGGVTVAGKAPLSLREIPNSVSVLTQERIQDQDLRTVADALRQTAGVAVARTDETSAMVMLRGFQSALGSFQFDGVPTYTVSTEHTFSAMDLALFDRVEVRKGADGLLQGPGNAGGTINMIRKRPQSNFGAALTLGAARFNDYRVQADVTGPLTPNRRLRGRVIGALQDSDSFIDVVQRRAVTMSGQLEFDVTPRTLVRGGIDWDDNHGGRAPGVPGYSDGRTLDVPRSTYLGAPWVESDIGGLTLYTELEHTFSKRWKLKGSFRQQDRNVGIINGYAFGAIDAADPAATTGRFAQVFQDSDQRARGVDVSAAGAFTALGREHELLMGGNWQSTSFWYLLTSSQTPGVRILGYDAHRDALPWGNLVDPDGPTDLLYANHGGYTSLRSHITDRLTATGGARVSWYHREEQDTPASPWVESGIGGVVTPYGGFVLDLGAAHSVYASYADIFRSQAHLLTLANEPLANAIGAQWETGLKGEYAQGRVNASVAFFHIIESNRSLLDPERPEGTSFYVNAGKWRSRGIEAEINGEVAPKLNLSMAYTYTDVAILVNRNGTGAPVGEGESFQPLTPAHMFNLWANHQVTERLSAGVGVTAQSEIFGGGYDSPALRPMIRQGPYAIASARLGYEFSEHYGLALNIDNLLDRSYYGRVASIQTGNRYGQPFTWTLNVRTAF